MENKEKMSNGLEMKLMANLKKTRREIWEGDCLKKAFPFMMQQNKESKLTQYEKAGCCCDKSRRILKLLLFLATVPAHRWTINKQWTQCFDKALQGLGDSVCSSIIGTRRIRRSLLEEGVVRHVTDSKQSISKEESMYFTLLIIHLLIESEYFTLLYPE